MRVVWRKWTLACAVLAGVVGVGVGVWMLRREGKVRVTFEARPFSVWDDGGDRVPSESRDFLRWLSPHSLRPPWEDKDLPALGTDYVQRPALFKHAAISRVVIHNETQTKVWFYITGSDPVYYRIRRGSGWTPPISLMGADEGSSRWETELKPGTRETVTVTLPTQDSLRLREPFQVGARLMRERPAFIRQLEALIGQWMPPSLTKPREVFVWSDTIEPVK